LPPFPVPGLLVVLVALHILEQPFLDDQFLEHPQRGLDAALIDHDGQRVTAAPMAVAFRASPFAALGAWLVRSSCRHYPSRPVRSFPACRTCRRSPSAPVRQQQFLLPRPTRPRTPDPAPRPTSTHRPARAHRLRRPSPYAVHNN